MTTPISAAEVKSPYNHTGGNTTVSSTTRKLANVLHRLDTFPERITSGDKFKKAGPLEYRLRRFIAMLGKWDVDTMNTFFKGRLSIPSNPIGLLLFVLFPIVIGARAFQAHRRDKTGTEVGDVLRRDITTLTLFVFMMPVVVNIINTLKQKRDGLNLTKKADPRDLVPHAYKYGQLADAFDLNNAGKLEAIIAEGNGKGFERASQKSLKMYQNLLADVDGGQATVEHYQKFVDTVKEMAAEGERLAGSVDAPKTNTRLQALSKAAYAHMEKAQETLTKLNTLISVDDSAIGEKLSAAYFKNKKNIPPFKEGLIHYAKMRRLPADLFSFAATAFLMGWAPVAFNNYLSRRRLEKIKTHHPELAPLQQAQVPATQKPNPFQKSASV
ncbi:MAG: hypothetical protein VKJ04_04540 [Vampirovibrionales bacterium]|nr:hypothetical protein [Vampirovibrionales bacterium]